MKVSIIIPLKKINNYLYESLIHIQKLNYDKNLIEVIILPDEEEKIVEKWDFKIKIIPTGSVHPGEKRDIGIKNSDGEICAFIDDDVYPSKNWLKSAVDIFKEDKNIAAVGGPAVTPYNDSFLQKVSGLIYSSFLASGRYVYRYIPKSKREVDDYPSCNLLIRRDVLEKINGFNTEFWPGEDTVICLKIVKDLKMKIIYSPDVLVYHHRRKFLSGHIKQVKNYALHRGYFVKKFPETSFKLTYFIPSFFVLYLISIFINLIFIKNRLFLFIYNIPLFLYLILLFIDGIKTKKYFFMVIMGIFITNVIYGIYFIKGLIIKKLKEEIADES